MPAFREEMREHAGNSFAKSADRATAPARRRRYGFPGSADRPAYGPHQRPDRPFQDARQGSPLAARLAEDGQPASQAARLSQAQKHREIPPADRAPWPAQVTPATPL